MSVNINYLKSEGRQETGTTKSTHPAPTSAVGVYTTNGTEIIGGVGVDLNGLVERDYLYAASIHEMRQIQGVTSASAAYLTEAFSSDVTDEAVYYVRTKFTSVLVTNNGGTPASINEGNTGGSILLGAGEQLTFNSYYGVEPMTFACSGNQIDFVSGY